jgi:hypothetical protein
VTTLEPTSYREDEDEMTFTGAWYTSALPIDCQNDKEDFSPAAYFCPTDSEPPAIIHRNAIYDSDDEDSVEDGTPLSTAVDDGATGPVARNTKRVHKKKNSWANVQEVLSEAEVEGTECSECDNCCDIKSSIDLSYFDKLTVVTFAWIICMEIIHSLLDFGWEKCVRPPWNLIAIPLFWQSTIFWDTLAYFFGTPSTPNTTSRRVKHSVAQHKRRKNCNMTYLFFISVGWIVLVGSILIPTAAFQGSAHPLSTVMMQLKGAYTLIQRLDEAVDLSPSTFLQYQSLEAKKLCKEPATEDKNNEVEGNVCSL